MRGYIFSILFAQSRLTSSLKLTIFLLSRSIAQFLFSVGQIESVARSAQLHVPVCPPAVLYVNLSLASTVGLVGQAIKYDLVQFSGHAAGHGKLASSFRDAEPLTTAFSLRAGLLRAGAARAAALRHSSLRKRRTTNIFLSCALNLCRTLQYPTSL